MSGDLTYDPRARRRPGASPVTLRVYAALVEHGGDHGLTVDEIDDLVRDGFPTDSYRAYERTLRMRRGRHGRNQSGPGSVLDFESPDFRRRARRWAIGEALRKMEAKKSRTARRHPDNRTRWLAGDRPPIAQTAWEVRPRRTEPILVPYDPDGDKAKMERYHATTRAIEQAEAALARQKLTTVEAKRVIADLLALVEPRRNGAKRVA